MATAYVEDVAFVRFSVPDLDEMEAFGHDFGLVVAHRASDAIYFRGTSDAPYLHMATLGAPGFRGVAFSGTPNDLVALSRAYAAPIEALDGPGGGKRVRLIDPDGFQVEVVTGREPAASLAGTQRQQANDAFHHERRGGAPKRLGTGPAHVVRLGHCVLTVSDFRRSEAWYKERFGFIASDEIVDEDGVFGEKGKTVGAFLRCDRGDKLTDHHTLFLLGAGPPGFHHAAFEVFDFDDLMSGHTHLASRSRTPEWGVGRHLLGSQVFDYWRDPWGHTVEHWTDGDVFDRSWGSKRASVTEALAVQWGPQYPKGNNP